MTSLEFLPAKFAEFIKPINSIISFNPACISIVGSYGNLNNQPTDFSDIDLVFIFNTDNIYRLFRDIAIKLSKIRGLTYVELGVHYQFGYELSIYYKKKYQKWIDIGIMDYHFAVNYMINFPKIDVYGTFNPQQNKQNPQAHLNHLGRRILNYLAQKEILKATILSYRYLNWLNIENVSKNISSRSKKKTNFYDNLKVIGNDYILEYVMKDIYKRERKWRATY
jgi:hypothetical protein